MEAGVMLDDFVAAAATIDEDATINEHKKNSGFRTVARDYDSRSRNIYDPILATGLSSSEIRNIELRTTNGQNLTDFVLIAGTSDVQSITGPMDIQRVTREYSLKIKDHVLNRCNLTEYRFSIQNGSLLLDQPSENNPDFAIVSLGASRKGRAQAVTVILHDAYLVHCATWYAVEEPPLAPPISRQLPRRTVPRFKYTIYTDPFFLCLSSSCVNQPLYD
ncbi:hypothetical protein OUZ56_018983 [Daphnia magna]|uniref:Uncharacterized protein n=1 Tax=Daphnia magna TaxID=35525 RepID=A0ABQ9ZAA7_9CRUS|nr:hypothetical protein OUZ56_018983 [Daphnia magna]